MTQPAFVDPVWISIADVLAVAALYQPCPECAGGLGILAGPGPQEWEITRGHELSCPTRSPRPPLTIVKSQT